MSPKEWTSLTSTLELWSMVMKRGTSPKSRAGLYTRKWVTTGYSGLSVVCVCVCVCACVCVFQILYTD